VPQDLAARLAPPGGLAELLVCGGGAAGAAGAALEDLEGAAAAWEAGAAAAGAARATELTHALEELLPAGGGGGGGGAGAAPLSLGDLEEAAAAAAAAAAADAARPAAAPAPDSGGGGGGGGGGLHFLHYGSRRGQASDAERDAAAGIFEPLADARIAAARAHFLRLTYADGAACASGGTSDSHESGGGAGAPTPWLEAPAGAAALGVLEGRAGDAAFCAGADAEGRMAARLGFASELVAAVLSAPRDERGAARALAAKWCAARGRARPRARAHTHARALSTSIFIFAARKGWRLRRAPRGRAARARPVPCARPAHAPPARASRLPASHRPALPTR
jgi:hypothetical protein